MEDNARDERNERSYRNGSGGLTGRVGSIPRCIIHTGPAVPACVATTRGEVVNPKTAAADRKNASAGFVGVGAIARAQSTPEEPGIFLSALWKGTWVSTWPES